MIGESQIQEEGSVEGQRVARACCSAVKQKATKKVERNRAFPFRPPLLAQSENMMCSI